MFLGIFILLSGFCTILKWTLAKQRFSYLIQGLFFLVLGGGFYRYNLNMTESGWMDALKHPTIINYVAILQLIETIALIAFAFAFIRSRVELKKQTWIQVFIWIPGVISTLGFIVIQNALFVAIDGLDYSLINGIYMISVWIACISIQFFISKVLPEWEIQTELLIVAAFIQLLASMFLPLIVSDLKSPGIVFTNDWTSIGISLSVIVGTILTGSLLAPFIPQLKRKLSTISKQ
ncbi:hypothetical protein EP331_10005 [bacterium]|nr:MAG: hypothetical protein EP331_10005 [bacterium]